MQKFLLTISAFLLLLAAPSCSIVDPDDIIPGYIGVDSIRFEDNTFPQPDHNITELWTDVNGRNLGIYEVPFTVPVLTTGSSRVMFRPGVFANGIRELKVAYPFYEHYITTVEFLPPNITHITPRFKFIEGLETDPTKTLIEDFENGKPTYLKVVPSSSFTPSDTADVDFEANNGAYLYPKGGNFSGLVTIPPGKRLFTVEDATWRNLTFVSETYLELSYKSDIQFAVGLSTRDNSGIIRDYFDLNLRPTSEWRKIYVFLQDDIGLLTTEYGPLTFKAGIQVNINTTSTSYIAVDNVRLMRYKQQ